MPVLSIAFLRHEKLLFGKTDSPQNNTAKAHIRAKTRKTRLTLPRKIQLSCRGCLLTLTRIQLSKTVTAQTGGGPNRE